jgi:hypothetical protein
MGQSIGRRELERRRLLAAGIVTAAGAEDCAADVFVWPEEWEKTGPGSETARYAEYARIANVQLD